MFNRTSLAAIIFAGLSDFFYVHPADLGDFLNLK
jgi:hypothetical protein